MLNTGGRFPVILAAGVLGIIATVILFFTAVSEPTGTQTIAITLLVLAECLTVFLVAGVERKAALVGIMFRGGAYPALAAYLFLSILLSAPFLFAWSEKVKWLYAAHALCICALCFAMAVLKRASHANESVNARNAVSGASLDELGLRIEAVTARFSGTPYGYRLAGIRDEIRYFDRACILPADEAIRKTVGDIERASPPDTPIEAENLTDLLDNLCSLVEKRKRETSVYRRGGF